jgi:hypothetical protein
MYKIFTRGNYFIIQDVVNNLEHEGLKKNILATRVTGSSSDFTFEGVNNFNQQVLIL